MNPAHIFLEILLLLAGPAGEKLETMRETKWEYFESEDKLKGYVGTSSKNLIQVVVKKRKSVINSPLRGITFIFKDEPYCLNRIYRLYKI